MLVRSCLATRLRANQYVVEFFANHEIDVPVFTQDILAISYDIDPPITESRLTENDAQFPNANEVAEKYEVFYHAFMEKEGIESNEFEDDDVGWSENADSEDSKESNEDVIDDTIIMYDDEEVLVERTHPTRFNVEDQRPYFSLGMTFPNTTKVRKSITKYCISRGLALKYVKTERNRIRVKCEDQCPFVLLVSKDNNNLRLVVKTLVPYHNCYKTFTNPMVSIAFLAQHYKTRILENHAYKIKDMKRMLRKN